MYIYKQTNRVLIVLHHRLIGFILYLVLQSYIFTIYNVFISRDNKYFIIVYIDN